MENQIRIKLDGRLLRSYGWDEDDSLVDSSSTLEQRESAKKALSKFFRCFFAAESYNYVNAPDWKKLYCSALPASLRFCSSSGKVVSSCLRQVFPNCIYSTKVIRSLRFVSLFEFTSVSHGNDISLEDQWNSYYRHELIPAHASKPAAASTSQNLSSTTPACDIEPEEDASLSDSSKADKWFVPYELVRNQDQYLVSFPTAGALTTIQNSRVKYVLRGPFSGSATLELDLRVDASPGYIVIGQPAFTLTQHVVINLPIDVDVATLSSACSSQSLIEGPTNDMSYAISLPVKGENPFVELLCLEQETHKRRKTTHDGTPSAQSRSIEGRKLYLLPNRGAAQLAALRSGVNDFSMASDPIRRAANKEALCMPTSPLLDVRRTTARVLEMSSLKLVSIDEDSIVREITTHSSLYSRRALPESWAGFYHYWNVSNPFFINLTAQYILVLDALNFCFWPLAGYEYDNLAQSLKEVLLKDHTAFDAEKLMEMTCDRLTQWLPTSRGVFIPLLTERVRLLREIGQVLKTSFGGLASNLVRSANGSAARLVELITAHFPGFRDHAIYQGEQVFFYKRAQIFAADIYGAFGKKLGRFNDLAGLTCFADYRVPQLLRALGILRYSVELADKIDKLQELPHGSSEEVEIRAATIQAVSHMTRYVNSIDKKQKPILEIEMDWLLWNRGEATKHELAPAHRVLSIFY